VKRLLPISALIILGICGLARRQGQNARPLPQPSVRSVQEFGTPDIASGNSDPRAREFGVGSGNVAPPLEAPPPVEEGVRANRSASDIDGMLNVLQSRLDLSEVQSERVALALGERARDLQACQEAYRVSGVFVPREYGCKLARLKESWYRSIDGILDTDQHTKFDALIRGGFFQPGTEFRADLNSITVLR
jgi:hypothetical protein